MTVLVFGQSGQVARALARHMPDARFLGRSDVDLTEPKAISDAIARHAPRAVINAAAYTAVDRAETEEPLAMAINAVAPGVMAEACAHRGIPLIHLSTDYVFDGSGEEAFSPDHPICPLNAYGRSKAAGEAAIAHSGATFGVLRTSWVFSAHGTNFVKTMLRLSETRNRLTIVDDQRGGPTPAAAIAMACATLERALGKTKSLSGIYHFSGQPDTSWAEFARAIFQMSGRQVEVQGIPSADYPTPARRPLNSRLECRRTHEVFGLQQPDWREALRDVLQELEVLA